MKIIPKWMRRKTIGQIAAERLDDTRLAILEAEANLERAKAELDLLASREVRLANYVEQWASRSDDIAVSNVPFPVGPLIND